MWISIMGSIVVLSACQRRKSKQPRCWESSWYFTLPMPIEAESPIVKPYTYHHTHMYIYIHIYQIYQSPILGYVLYSYLFLVMYIYIYIIFIKHLSPDPLTNHRFVRLRKYWTLLLEVAAVFAWIYFCTTGALDEGDGRRGRMGRMRCDACVGG